MRNNDYLCEANLNLQFHTLVRSFRVSVKKQRIRIMINRMDLDDYIV